MCSSFGLSWLGLCTSWIWLTVYFPTLENISAIISSNIFSGPFSLFFSWDPYHVIVHLMFSQKSYRLFSFFFLILFCSSSTILPSKSLIYSSVSIILLLFLSSVVFIYFIVHLCLVFSSSRSLLNISCIFSVCAPNLFLRSWIIFNIITLNSFLARTTSLSCSSG